ncbi:MAG: hypothetical protein AAF500_14290 [Myxococcota bacterium]
MRGVAASSAWLCGVALAAVAAFPLYNIDAYGHLAQGRQIATLGRVPKTDPFSFWKPEPQPWSNYEWGYDLLTWLVYDAFGPNALIMIKCVAIGATGYLLVKLATRLVPSAPSAGPIAAALVLVAAPFARIRFTVRPQLVGLLFPAVLLLAIRALYDDALSRRRVGWIWFGVGLMQVVWVNLHGSHLFGLLISVVAVFVSVRTNALKRMLVLLALQLLATACTPFGVSIVTDAVAHVFVPAYREVVIEWGPWSPGQPLYLLLAPMVMTILVLFTFQRVVRTGRFGLVYAVLCVILSAMAFRSIRFVAHELLLSAPFVAAGLAQTTWAETRSRLVAGSLAVSMVWALVLGPRLEPFVPFGFGEPRLGHAWAAAEVLEEHVEAPRIMAPMQDSWPLMFAVPDATFLVDGRVPFYGPAWVRQVTNAFSDPVALRSLLRAHDVTAVVVDHTRAAQLPAVEVLRGDPDWVLGQTQDRQSLFVRKDVAASLTPLEVVGPGFGPGRMLESDVTSQEIEREMEWVGHHRNAGALQGWLQGLRELRPMARDGNRRGIRRYLTEGEREAARQAYQVLGAATDMYPGFTTIELYRGLAALAACDLDEARTSLARAAYAGETRETALASFELVLRGGSDADRAAALDAIDGLLARPDVPEDPWLRAIRDDFDTRCP